MHTPRIRKSPERLPQPGSVAEEFCRAPAAVDLSRISSPKTEFAFRMATAMLSSLVIETEALCKVYGQERALNGVNLQVAPGAIGLLGPNGAGKSTFMKCLLQLQPITSGSAKLLGREVGREGREIRKRVGYTPEQDCHIPGMVCCEYVTYCAQL